MTHNDNTGAKAPIFNPERSSISFNLSIFCLCSKNLKLSTTKTLNLSSIVALQQEFNEFCLSLYVHKLIPRDKHI